MNQHECSLVILIIMQLNSRIKIIRITTVPGSMRGLLKGQLRYMNNYFEVIGVTSPGEQIKDIVGNEGIRVKSIEMSRKLTPFKDIVSLVKLVIFVRKEKPFIVHTHTPKAGTLGMVAAWICQVPIRLHTVAGLPLMETIGVKRKLLNFVENVTYLCATRVYPNSLALRDFIIVSKFCNPDKLKVIGNGSSNGINSEFFSSATVSSKSIEKVKIDYGITPPDFVFIFIGRLVKDKGINELVAAFEKISGKFKHVKLLLVGKQEPELDPLKKDTLEKIQSNPDIIPTGYQIDVRPFLLASHVLVFPSYREGFPNVPMQAGAMGLPSIVTDINGCNEIVRHGHNGLIIPPKNAEVLEKVMQQLIEDKQLTQNLTVNARESIVSRFDQQTLWKQIKQEYDDNLKQKEIIN